MEDVIYKGQASGNVANVLMATDFDVRGLRPWIGKDGRAYCDRVVNGKPKAIRVTNADATLRKDEWKLLDTAVTKAAVERLNFVSSVRGKGLQFVLPNGMGTTVLQTQNISDVSAASQDMEGLVASQADRPVFDLTNLPLPITHKDFHFSARQIATSRRTGTPIDTSMAELAGRKVAEAVEKLSVGRTSSFTYGGGTVYGLSNFTHNLTKTLTQPTGSNGTTVVEEILAMRQQSQDAHYYGPWHIFNAPSWDQYLDDDFKSDSDITLRERIMKINGIQSIQTLDFLQNYDLALVQMTSDVIRMVVGMEVVTVQWDTHGGMQKNFKVMAIIVPQFRADYNDNTGIVYGSV